MLHISLIIFNIIILFKIDYLNKIFNIYDYPDKKRKLQTKPVAITGGIILFANILIILFYLYFNRFNSEILINNREFFLNLFLIFFFGIVGLIDDKIDLSALKKIIIMIFFIGIYILFTDYGIVRYVYFQNGFLINFHIYSISFFITLFCIFTLTLTLNMFDGIDGQSIILFIFLVLYLYFIHKISFLIYLIYPLLILLILNLNQKVYMGDNGIMIFSAFISIILIKYNFLNPEKIFVEQIFLIFLLPALDLIRLTTYRIYKKKNPLKADLNHIHHLATKIISKKSYIILLFFFYLITLLICIFKINLSYYLITFIFIYICLIIFSTLKINKKL